MISYIYQYYEKLRGFAIETNVMQELFADTVKEKFVQKGFHVTWVDIKNTAEKDLRIYRLAPKIRNGYIKFHRSQAALINQLKNYPKGKKDGIDALEMAINIAVENITNAFSFTQIALANKSPNAFQRNHPFIKEVKNVCM
jgi:predicted phage terminase large subunit-like protein